MICIDSTVWGRRRFVVVWRCEKQESNSLGAGNAQISFVQENVPLRHVCCSNDENKGQNRAKLRGLNTEETKDVGLVVQTRFVHDRGGNPFARRRRTERRLRSFIPSGWMQSMSLSRIGMSGRCWSIIPGSLRLRHWEIWPAFIRSSYGPICTGIRNRGRSRLPKSRMRCINAGRS